MKKEELENKLKISEKTYIHCPTLELAEQVLNIFHQLGLKWCDETHYTLDPNWDDYKESTTYCPFDGGFVSLEFARLKGFKIINAEEFIALHTEGEEFDLENYIPKGQLEGFPKEIIARMLDCQQEQGNPRDISVFEKQCDAGAFNKGFTWDETQEGFGFWEEVIDNKNFNLFFEQYPKKDYQESKTAKYVQVGDNDILSDITPTQSSVEINTTEDNSQEFRVGDEVIDILTGQRGKILEMNTNGNNLLPLYVSFSKGKEPYTLDGRFYPKDKYPRLLHFRDDYNYTIINFNNLPKRQEPKRWRAKKNGVYHLVNFDNECWFFTNDTEDEYDQFDNYNYNSGNYFRTEVEAETIAQKLNEYFKQLIQEEHE